MSRIVCCVVPRMCWREVGMAHIVCSVVPACIGGRWACPTWCVAWSPACVGGRFGTWGVSLADLPIQTPSTLVVSEVCGNL